MYFRFMRMLLTERVPDFMPEPVFISREIDVFHPETPFEVKPLLLEVLHALVRINLLDTLVTSSMESK